MRVRQAEMSRSVSKTMACKKYSVVPLRTLQIILNFHTMHTKIHIEILGRHRKTDTMREEEEGEKKEKEKEMNKEKRRRSRRRRRRRGEIPSFPPFFDSICSSFSHFKSL